MLRVELYDGKVIIFKGVGTSAETGERYDLYLLCVNAIGLKRVMFIDGRTREGVFISSVYRGEPTYDEVIEFIK